MTFQPGANLYAVAVGTHPEGVEVPFISTVAPSSSSVNFPIGKRWIVPTVGEYVLQALSSAGGTLTATWTLLGTNGGPLNTLTADSGGALSPTAGNINILGTANQVTTTGAGSTITVSTPATFIAPGSIAATTTVTATLGNITATNGNLSLATAGNKIVIATGANASVGTSGVMSGTPGAVTVATTASSATAKIFYSRATTGGTPGNVSITAQDGTGFTLTSTGNETSTFNWWIINA